MREIKVVPYDSTWPEEYKAAKKAYKGLLNDLDVHIEHVGSTAIEGLYAKPILDIDIIVETKSVKKEVIKRLGEMGYTHLGTMGIDGREAFSYNEKNPKITWMAHHLYVCMTGSISLRNHLLLKKHLKENTVAVREYSELKLELSKKFKNDIDSYIEGKTKLISSYLQKEGLDSASLETIKSINKKD